MKKIRITKNTILFLIIFLIATWTRFYNIQKVPTFIYQDEMGYLISAISMNLSGSDIVGTWNPLSLSPVSPSITALDELTTNFIYPFYKLNINPILAGKLPFILIGLLVPFFIAGIAYEFTKSKYIRNWTWIISLFNPWIWQLSRMSVDPFVSFFFYILGAYLLIKLKNWHKLWSIPVLFFGFYNYQGHKLVFIFWVFLFSIYSVAPYLTLAKSKLSSFKNINYQKLLPTLTVFLFSLVLFLTYIFIQLPKQKSSERLNTIFTPNSKEIIKIVNEKRRLSLDFPLNSKLINKYTIWTEKVFERFSETYSFRFLFLEVQNDGANAAFSVWQTGIFYIVDSLLIFLGFVYLLNKKRYKFLSLIIFGLIITVIPSLISGSKAYFYRSSLNIPFLIILAGIGMYYIKTNFSKYLIYLIYLLYLISIAYFSYIYFIRYPMFSSKRQFFADRVLVEYLRRLPKTQKVIVLSPELEFSVTSYLFYTQYLNKNNINDIQKMFQSRKYQIGNIQFVDSCLPKNVKDAQEVVISRWDTKKCSNNEKSVLTFNKTEPTFYSSLQLKDIDDNGTVFDIYNDKLCLGQELNPYLHIFKSEQFDFKNQNNKEFCSNWISKFIDK